jgi:hypothetical protein
MRDSSKILDISRIGVAQKMNLKFFPSIFVLLMLLNVTRVYGEELFSHRVWEEVLSEYVDEQGLVDYVGLSRNPTTFESYILQIEEIGPRTNPELFPTENDRLAFYINAYNALTFKGVLSRGPEESSVWTGLISGYIFFEVMDIQIEGYRTTLKSLEDDIIRARFQDPRIHAAINCASISCPRLSRKAFTGSALGQQLDDSMNEFISKKTNVALIKDVLYLSSIFNWFEEDFVSHEVRNGQSAGSDETKIIHYINRYRSRDDLLDTDLRVRYFDYDKGINKQ